MGFLACGGVHHNIPTSDNNVQFRFHFQVRKRENFRGLSYRICRTSGAVDALAQLEYALRRKITCGPGEIAVKKWADPAALRNPKKDSEEERWRSRRNT